ncbi:MAG: hypothetical protein IJ002_00135 [Clostridia bacterium]|nr:hypothetical protein [Clostridia bacterium]
MDENKNNEMSVDELLEKLKASLQTENENTSADNIDGDDEIKKAVEEALGYDEKTEAETEPVETTDPAAESVEESSETVEDVVEETGELTEEAETEAVEAPTADINEEDILAAWGIDRADVPEKPQTVEVADNADVQQANVSSNTKIYRIARIESKADHSVRKQTESQKKSVDYDRDDCKLLNFALGMEKTSGEPENTVSFEVDELATPKTIDEPHAEFTYQRQRDDIAADYEKAGRSSLVKLIATAVFALLLFAVECLPAFGIGTPDVLNASAYPVIYSMATLQLMLLCAAVSYKEIANGFFGLLKFKFTSGGMLAVLMFVCAVCGIVNCALGTTAPVYHFSAAFLALAVRVFEYLDVRREALSFEISSSTKTKKYVALTVPRDEAADIEGLEDYTGEDSLVLRTEKCSFVENYFARTEKRSERDIGANKYLVPIFFAVAVISLIVTLVKGSGVAEALGTFNLAFAVGTPVLVLLSSSYPLYKATKKLYHKESTIIGEGAVDEYSGTTMICFDDADAFPSYGVTLENLRIYGSGDIETIIEQMGAVFAKLGGPLKSVFGLMTSDCPRPYRVKIEGVYETGISAAVDGRTLFVGTADYMEENGFKVVDRSSEIGGKHFSTMYLAEDGGVRAKFYIRYTLDGGFESIVKKLARRGISSVILTGDSNINDELLAQFIDIAKLPVKVVRRKDFDKASVNDRADSGVVARGSVGDLVSAVTMCDRLASVIGTMRAVRVASAVICAALVVGASVLSMSGTVASAYVFIYHLFWMVPAWLVAKINL